MRSRYALIFFVLCFSGCAHRDVPEARHPENCERDMDAYDQALTEFRQKKQACAKDDDCELLFYGALSGCDLGFAVSKPAMGEGYFKKLDRLRDVAQFSCPESSFPGMQCEAIPYAGTKCRKGVCEPVYDQ